MKRKTGLQKKISSIFDGVPLPGRPDDVPSENYVQQSYAPAQTLENKRPAYTEPRQTPQAAPSKPFELTEQLDAAPDLAGNVRKTLTVCSGFVDKLFISKDGQIDQRQKKMAVLVGVLSIVLVAVLLVIFRQPNKPFTPKPLSDRVISDLKINFIPPNPLPGSLRNPMIAAGMSSPSGSSAEENFAGSEPLISGIVFNPDNSEKSVAIIGGKYYTKGQEIYGFTIVNINKNSVEFKDKDGKSSTATVGASR